MLKKTWRYKYLFMEMLRREISGSYKGSMIGFAWAYLHPLLMLMVYTFVFGVVFQSRWKTSATPEDFALNLFAGLIVFGVFAECINRAPGLILSNVNYVKKVVFPLSIIVPTVVLSSLFHAMISLAILVAFFMLIHGMPHWTILWLPLVWLPFILLILGLSWFLSALGVYLRDISQVVGVTVTAMMFLSPIFYPISALPDNIRDWIFLNPLSLIITETRDVVLLGLSPDWLWLGEYGIFSLMICILGYWWFVKTSNGFADVI